MEFLQPEDWREALEARAAHPGALPLWGGTDVMVDLNFGRARPEAILDLTRVRELADWDQRDGVLRVGAGVSYTRAIAELGTALPGLAAAARTVGSPQIRNAGTIGGNLVTASPAGDTLPILVALDAKVEIRGGAAAEERRVVPVAELITGPKRTSLAPGELITAVRVPVVAGPQEFLKVGVRNAMVIAIASCALVVDLERRQVA